MTSLLSPPRLRSMEAIPLFSGGGIDWCQCKKLNHSLLVPLFQYQIRDCPSPCFVSSATLRQTPCVNNLGTKTWRIDPWRKQSYSIARNRQFCSNEKMTVNKTSMRTINKHCRSEIFVCVVSTAIDGDSASSVKFSTQVKCVF